MNTRVCNDNYFLTIFSILLGLLTVSPSMASELLAPQIPIELSSRTLKNKIESDVTFKDDFNKATLFIETVINPHVDFNRVSALVLGKLWKKATTDEKLRFRKEFHTLLVRTYSRAFFEFKDWSVRFIPLKMKEGAKKVIVKTEIIQPGLPVLSINYRMILVKGIWKSYDIMIEGVSLVTNYRTSIKNEYRKSGSLDAVINLLARRNTAALAKSAKKQPK